MSSRTAVLNRQANGPTTEPNGKCSCSKTLHTTTGCVGCGGKSTTRHPVSGRLRPNDEAIGGVGTPTGQETGLRPSAASILPIARDLSQTPAHTRQTGRPSKSLDASVGADDELKPSPMQGSATIKCDGNGGYEVLLNGWSGAACGTKDCVIAHETSHKADWEAKWPDGCKKQPKGYLPKGDPPDNPLMTAAEYKTFLKESECKAHTVDLKCAQALPKPEGCKTTVDDYIALTEKQRAEHCPASGGGLSLGATVGIAIGLGAALVGGALIGASAAGLF